MKRASKPNDAVGGQPILAPWQNGPAAKLLQEATGQVVCGCSSVQARATKMFYFQLKTGLWWEAAKISASTEALAKKIPGKKKASPISSLYLGLKAKKPDLFAARTLTGWGRPS